MKLPRNYLQQLEKNQINTIDQSIQFNNILYTKLFNIYYVFTLFIFQIQKLLLDEQFC